VNQVRGAAVLTGVLFIAATAAGVLSVVTLGSLIQAGDYQAQIAGHLDQAAAGALFEALMGLACAGIAIALYPVLRLFNSGLAIGAVGMRLIEGVLFVVAAVAALALVELSRNGADASTAELLRAIHGQSAVLAALPFGVGALLYYYAFYRYRIIPRWLSGWGLLAIVVYLAATGLAILTRTAFDDYTALLMPLALQEMVLAAWLIAKGFNPAAFAAVGSKEVAR
jgi:hypothetical protein